MEKAVFHTYTGTESEASVSFSPEGDPVTEIEAKAFLSCKSVEKLTLCDSVEKIGDWAFAHMQNLKLLVLPRRRIALGRKVFLDCESLTQIQIRGDESGNPGTPFFMASAMRLLKKEALFSPETAGDSLGHKEWLGEYDKALLHFMQEDDKEGFEPVFIGWFHVEDTDEQIPRYLEKRRKQKTELVFQRLLYPAYLDQSLRNLLERYLREHMPEEGGEKEHLTVFSLLCDSGAAYGRDIRYMKIMERAGALSPENIQHLLEHMEGGSPEVTAYLLKKKSEASKGQDYFGALAL